MALEIECQDYAIQRVYQELTRSERNEIIIFWLENGALKDIEEAQRRVDEVVFAVHNREDEVVGISTVYLARDGVDNEMFLHYRMFIRPQDRTAGLMKKLVRETRLCFDSQPALRSTARGMIIYAENPKLMRPGARRQFERSLWNYAGKDQRGLDMWKFNFTVSGTTLATGVVESIPLRKTGG